MEKFKELKLNKKVILIVAVFGVFLMLFSGNIQKNDNYESDEDKLEHMLSHIDGAGDVKVMLSKNEDKSSVFSDNKNDKKYIGAIILAEGGGASRVREKIIKAVNAVTGLDAHRIIVYKLE